MTDAASRPSLPLQQADPKPAEDERRDRWTDAYGKAILTGGGRHIAVLMAAADAEQAELQAALRTAERRFQTQWDAVDYWAPRASAAEGRLAAIQALPYETQAHDDDPRYAHDRGWTRGWNAALDAVRSLTGEPSDA